MALIRQFTNSPSHYGWGSIILHWFIACGVLGLYPLGLYIDSLSYYDPAYRTVPHWHKSIGILLAIIFVVRMIWRFSQPAPQPAAQQSQLIHNVTKLVHGGLYGLLLTVFISGYLISTADGRAISVFGWFQLPALPTLFMNQEDVAGSVHFYIASALMAMVGLHVIGALKHHIVDKDTTLTRMLGIKER